MSAWLARQLAEPARANQAMPRNAGSTIHRSALARSIQFMITTKHTRCNCVPLQTSPDLSRTITLRHRSSPAGSTSSPRLPWKPQCFLALGESHNWLRQKRLSPRPDRQLRAYQSSVLAGAPSKAQPLPVWATWWRGLARQTTVCAGTRRVVIR